MKKERAERTRFAILDLGDFDAYKAEHVTLTEQEQREDTKRKDVYKRQGEQYHRFFCDTGVGKPWLQQGRL